MSQPHVNYARGAAPGFTPENSVLLEAFEWYSPADGKHWRRLAQAVPGLKRLGINYIWLPPGCKAGWEGSNGYDVYDMYDLGEFDQKGARATKWGTKEELMDLMHVAREHGTAVLWDAVLNHKSAADYTEKCQAVVVDKDNRLKELSGPQEVEVWTGYDFAARAGRYSQMKYHWHHFSGTDWEARLKTNEKLYKFVGPQKPGWALDVDDSDGNADYLMGNDLDYSQREVRQDMMHWGTWITQELGLSGFRLDAVKHFSSDFLQSWISHLDQTLAGPPLLMIGEYWRDDLRSLGSMIEKLRGRLLLFDVMLATNMSKLSVANDGDMRGILTNTLTQYYPQQAVSFVINHDTQSRFERDHAVTAISPWFIPLAYAFILLRAHSGFPCVFYGDLYGICGPAPLAPSCQGKLPKLILARKLLAYGEMRECWDDRHCVGFSRMGDAQRREGVAVVMTNAEVGGGKRMEVGTWHAGEVWTDLLGGVGGSVVIDGWGCGVFTCAPRSVAVWARRDGPCRAEIDGSDL
ncbi:uncharacterized protein HMPREF1541_09927 [Cyphellophora europaea CBS 101466]|uniref:Glycosyl hydrolase family 13 catalytic domain-containing protein n=1 Tax=Cyphellophora europaea (strain CBS 101466) TaxID=1220924 RepID=W2S8K6_CYPE1|nr:uncharacterized protein HMPREF1541_09927 [Cyphellophora europaea CBS 101466]ETN45051.1 hypothetical protein HMPREF1541_09927 [Cyphellophora europaea CBS 101466]